MKVRGSFAAGLFVWFVAGMTTEATISRALDELRRVERLSSLSAHCTLRGGTLVQSEHGRVRCVACRPLGPL